MGSIQFDTESPLMEPHSLVRMDKHPGKLRGRLVELIVHPLLEIYGRDEGKRYEEEARVLVPAEAWLDSNLPTDPMPWPPKPAQPRKTPESPKRVHSSDPLKPNTDEEEDDL